MNTNKSVLGKEELLVLKAELPRSTTARIAKELGYTQIYVRSVLAGTWPNEAVIEAALKIRDEHRQKIADLKKRILS